MENRIKFISNIEWLSEDEKNQVFDIIDKNLKWKADVSLKKIFSNNPEAELIINYSLLKNKKSKYETTFRFNYNWKQIIYKNDEPFKYLPDLINHAFEHFTRQVAEK